MDAPGYKDLFIVTKDQQQAIRENVGLNRLVDINDIIDLIIEWFQTQPHLPRIKLDRRFVEFLLIQRKGSIERTKLQIDAMFTLKTKIPELISPRDISLSAFQKVRNCAQLLPLPKLDDKNCRVFVYRIISSDLKDFDLEVLSRLTLMYLELRLIHDCSTADHFIIDLEKAGLSFLTKMAPSTIKKAEILYQDGYSLRLAGIHLVKCGRLTEEMAKLFKMVLKPKLASRIFVHSNEESLHKVITPRVLPKDYGGDEVSIDELSDKWYEELDQPDVKKYLLESETWTTNENLRLGDMKVDGMFNVPGSFRKLQVD